MRTLHLIQKCLAIVLFWYVVSAGIGLAFEPPPQGAMETTLDLPIHFKTPEGKGQVLPPGDYRVETGEHSLHLFHQTQGIEWAVEAQWATHSQDIPSRMVVAIPEKTDLEYLIVLFPNGKSLEAIGSYSGVWARDLKRIGSAQVREIIKEQNAPEVTVLRPVIQQFFTIPELWTLQPNGTLFLKGMAFGNNPGEVYLRLKDPYAVELKLSVEKWNNTEIRAKIPSNITGVKDHVASYYVIRPDKARSGSKTMGFKALREKRKLLASDGAVAILHCSDGADVNSCNSHGSNATSCYSYTEKKRGSTIDVLHKNCDVAFDADDGEDKFQISLKNGWLIQNIIYGWYTSSGNEYIFVDTQKTLNDKFRGKSSWTQKVR